MSSNIPLDYYAIIYGNTIIKNLIGANTTPAESYGIYISTSVTGINDGTIYGNHNLIKNQNNEINDISKITL